MSDLKPKKKNKSEGRVETPNRLGSFNPAFTGDDGFEIKVSGYDRTIEDQVRLERRRLERQKYFETYLKTSSPSSSGTDWFDILSYQIRLSPLHPDPPSDDSGRDLPQLDRQSSFTSVPLSCILSGFGDRLLSNGNSRSDLDRIREYLNVWMKGGITNEMGESTEDDESSRTFDKANKNTNDPGFLTKPFESEVLGIQWSTSFSTSVSTPTACALSSDPQTSVQRLLSFLDLVHRSHLNILIRKPEKLIEPILKPYPIQNAPEYRPDGTIKEPLPEKGWIAKYWMYILPAVVLLVLGGGATPEEEGGNGATSTNQQAPRPHS